MSTIMNKWNYVITISEDLTATDQPREFPSDWWKNGGEKKLWAACSFFLFPCWLFLFLCWWLHAGTVSSPLEPPACSTSSGRENQRKTIGSNPRRLLTPHAYGEPQGSNYSHTAGPKTVNISNWAPVCLCFCFTRQPVSSFHSPLMLEGRSFYIPLLLNLMKIRVFFKKKKVQICFS